MSETNELIDKVRAALEISFEDAISFQRADIVRDGIHAFSAIEGKLRKACVNCLAAGRSGEMHRQLDETVATVLSSDPYDERTGVRFTLEDWKRLEKLPAGTRLYAHTANSGLVSSSVEDRGLTTDDPYIKEQKPVLRHLTEGEREAIYHAFHPNPAVDKWKDAVIDALVLGGIFSKEHDNDPRKAIRDLIMWEQKIALEWTWDGT